MVRTSMPFDDPSRTTAAPQQMKDLHQNLGFDGVAAYGTWEEVPIICSTLQNRKRGPGERRLGGSRRNSRQVRDMVPNLP
jgi:hypothetical protein